MGNLTSVIRVFSLFRVSGEPGRLTWFPEKRDICALLHPDHSWYPRWLSLVFPCFPEGGQLRCFSARLWDRNLGLASWAPLSIACFSMQLFVLSSLMWKRWSYVRTKNFTHILLCFFLTKKVSQLHLLTNPFFLRLFEIPPLSHTKIFYMHRYVWRFLKF